MARFAGKIGFVLYQNDEYGVHKEVPVERTYYGDLNRFSHRMQGSDSLNENIVINNEISIVADPYANENCYAIRYVVMNGIKWKVNSVDIQYPRINLSLGEVYHG